MKISVVFLLLLLVCSVSTDQTKVEAAKESAAQPKLEEIHALLREMAASLNQLKVDVALLQTENRVQATQLKELEGQKTEIKKLKKEQKAQAAKLKELEKVKTEVDELKHQQQVKKVAFSAGLYPGVTGNFGPFNTITNLPFRNVYTNIGNAYNPNTGIFTAPVKGVYQFEWHIGVHASSTAAALFKNGERLFSAWEGQSDGFGTSSQGANLILNVGDVVHLRLVQTTKVFDSENRHSTFSGHLLFTM